MARRTSRPARRAISAAVLAGLRKTNRLVVAEDKTGQLWASNSYWMVRVDADHAIAKLLAEFNLPLAQMVCDVSGRAITRTDAKGPNVDAILDHGKTVDLVRYTLGGRPVQVDVDGRTAGVWERKDGTVVTLSEEFVSFVELVSTGDHWMQAGGAAGELKPAFRFDGKTVTAVLMPVRNLIMPTQLKREAAA